MLEKQSSGETERLIFNNVVLVGIIAVLNLSISALRPFI